MRDREGFGTASTFLKAVDVELLRPAMFGPAGKVSNDSIVYE